MKLCDRNELHSCAGQSTSYRWYPASSSGEPDVVPVLALFDRHVVANRVLEGAGIWIEPAASFVINDEDWGFEDN